MTKTISSFSTIAIILCVLLYASAAEALSARTWVSGAGNDASPCSRSSPCSTFQFAYANTAAGGEIDVLDGADFGPLNISKAITVANDGAGTAAITSTSTDGIFIQAGSNDAVVIRGLNLNGVVSEAPAIEFRSGASLLIDHCSIQGFQTHPAIYFLPGGASKLGVKDTVLSNDGFSSGSSVWILPQTGGVADAHFERVRILNAIGNGIRVDGTAGGVGGGAADVELHDVTVDGASGGSGIVAVSTTSGGPTIKIVADKVTASHNAGYGFRAVGGTASVYLSHSVSEDNSVGLGASSGGVVYSYGDNRFANNTSGNGVTPTAIPPE